MEKDNKLEKLRMKLYKAISNSDLLDEEVINLSQKLDLEIIEFYKQKRTLLDKEKISD